MYLVCLLDVRPESRNELLAALDRLVEHSRTEPGTLQYEVLTDIENPARIVVFERYTDADALQAHLDSGPVSSTLAKFGDYLTSPPILVRSTLRAGFLSARLRNQI